VLLGCDKRNVARRRHGGCSTPQPTCSPNAASTPRRLTTSPTPPATPRARCTPTSPAKDALFFALLDRHLDDQVAQVDRILAAPSDADLRAELRDASAEQLAAGGSFGLLTLEFWLYAARDAAARVARAARYRRIRDRLAAVIAERDTAREITDSTSPHEQAALVLALDAGLFLQHLIDPDAITPQLRANALAALIDPERHG
jgi:AcrR family transcriptional regulator